MIVAIDGPAGSGKGTITKQIKEKLGFVNLDTGATYRCVALESINENVDITDEKKMEEIAKNIDIKIDNSGKEDVILLNGKDVSKEIRTQEVNSIVSKVSSIIPVRKVLVEKQRKLAQGKNVVVEGRDIGTVVFPNADLKIYLDANVEERAKRRYIQNKSKGIDTTYEEVLQSVKNRDYNDMHKTYGALKKAEDAVVIDTSNLSIDQVTDKIVDLIKSKQVRTRVAGIVKIGNGIALVHRKNVKRAKEMQEYYVTPGGGLEENETCEECIKREIKEELGIEVKPIKLWYEEFSEKFNQKEVYYLCEYISGKFGTGTGAELTYSPDYPDYGNFIPEIVDYEKLKTIPLVPETIKEKLLKEKYRI